MEMYNTSDYLRVNPLYKVRAVETNEMSVDPDKKEERRREERRNLSSSRKEKKSAHKTEEYAQVYSREIEAVSQKKKADQEGENSPYLLWMYMTAKQGKRKY